MKSRFYGFALLAALFPTAVWAFDWTADDTDNYLTDPSFRVREGQLESLTTFGYTNTNEDWHYLGGQKTAHYFGIGDSYSQTFYYGVTDRLRVRATGSYTETQGKESYYDGTSPSEFWSHQFNNPIFSAAYRLIEQKGIPVSLDTAVIYTPNVVASTAPSTGLELMVNRQTKSATFQVVGGTNYTGQTKFQDNGAYITDQWSYYGGINDQFRFTEHWAVNSGVTVYYNAPIHNTIPDAGIAYSAKNEPSIYPYITVIYKIIPNSMAVGFEYDHNLYGDAHLSGSYNGTWTNQVTNGYYLHLDLLF